MYYRDADAVIVVYDITFKVSFENARDWLKELNETTDMNEMSKFLVGNKCDLYEEIQVTTEDGEALSKEISADRFSETSAKSNIGISELFQSIGEVMYKKHLAK